MVSARYARVRACTHAYTYARERAPHGKHQINHLINFAEVVVVVMVVAAAATAVVVNSKRLVGYFTVTFTSVVDDGYFFFCFLLLHLDGK